MSVCSCAYLNNAPFNGFDDIRFRVLIDPQSGVLPDWVANPIIVSKHVPNSNFTVNQVMGMGPGRVTWSLWFECNHQYYALFGRQGTMGTISILAGFQSLAGTQKTMLGEVYDQLDQCLLISLANPQFYLDGHIEVQATWQRAIDPITRLAVV